MRRHLLTTLAALSLLLCVAVLVLWVRSRSRFDVVGHGSASDGWTYPHPANKDYAFAGPSGGWTNTWFVGSGEGTCLLYAARQTWPPGRPVFGYIETGWIDRIGTADMTFLDENVLPERQTMAFGFQFEQVDGGPNFRLTVPHWSLALLTAVPPLAWLRSYRRRRWRRRTGRCPDCGYDLRATPAQCPECGAGHAVASPSP